MPCSYARVRPVMLRKSSLLSPRCRYLSDTIRHEAGGIQEKHHDKGYDCKWKRIAAHSGRDEQSEKQRRR